MSEQLDEAKKILEEKELLLKKYPNKFSLRVDVRQWSGIVGKLEREESNQETKEDLSGPIGCLINMKRQFEDEMDKIISEESNESMEKMEILVQNYNIAVDVLEEANTRL